MKYEKLVKCYKDLENQPSTLKKTEILSSFLKNLKSKDYKEIIYLLQGRAFPDYQKKDLGISENLIQKALEKATGANSENITNEWKKLGDLGLVAEKVVKNKTQKTLSKKELTSEKVLSNIQKLPEFEGKKTVDKKISLVAELITAAKPLEARYIVRTILHDMRIGVGSGTLRDAITNACFGEEENIKKYKELVQEAYDKTTDFSVVFEKACKGEEALKKINLKPGKPVKVMLFQKAETVKEGFEKVGQPCLIEYKYDGFRMLINKDERGEIKIFTRRLEEITKQFPEVKEYIEKYVEGENFILDTEAVGYDSKKKEYMPFQEISQRIKRKYDIEKVKKELPVEINVFDILYYNGKSLLKKPLEERREIIEKNVENKNWKIRPSKAIKTKSIKEANKFYNDALKKGEEGVMMKNLSAPYKPGSRVGYGVKVKPAENELDLVITGADYGKGKRAGWLTSFYVACQDPDKDKFLEIGKVSTGLKEKESEGLSYKEMTNKMKKLEKESEGRHIKVEPKIIVEITYQNIQKSPTYNSGYALRFPRFTRLRPDKNMDEISTIGEIEKLK